MNRPFDAIETERVGWYELVDLVRSLTLEECLEPGYYRDPDWTVRDVVAHLGTWLAEAEVQLERLRAGTYEGHAIDIDALNATFLEAMADQPWSVAWIQARAGRTMMLGAWSGLAEPSEEAAWWIRKSGADHLAEHLPDSASGSPSCAPDATRIPLLIRRAADTRDEAWTATRTLDADGSHGAASRAMTGATTQPTISVARLWKIFGPAEHRIVGTPDERLTRAEIRAKTGSVVAVRDVSFDVRRGEVFVVMGLSGSGKSTLVRCLTRLIEPTSGRVLLDGEDIRAADQRRLRELRRRRFSMVFQHFGLLPHRRVIDNVAFGLEIRGAGRRERHERAREVISLVGLDGCDDWYPDQLSGGMQQRVGLARALAVDPEVMLFDEPFSALDPLIRREMQNEVKRLHREVGKTMVFITHDLAEALKLGDHIVIMRDGEVVQAGRGADIVGAPANDYVADFVSDVPRSNVLTLRWVMRDPTSDERGRPGPEFPPDTVIRDAVGAAAESEAPIRVIEDGQLVGIVDRSRILSVIASGPRPTIASNGSNGSEGIHTEAQPA